MKMNFRRFFDSPRREAILLVAVTALSSCASLPEPKFKKFHFPEEAAFVDAPSPERKYRSLGPVRTRIDYSAMIQDKTEDELCKNYYNKAVRDLLFKAQKRLNADAVINIRSVVFYLDGKTELHKDPQCSEDEAEGQILLQGEAVRWEKSADVKRRKRI